MTIMDVKEVKKLNWPTGWKRTLIAERKPRAQWKKSYEHYRDAVLKELGRFGATAVTISRNEMDEERRDPGVAVWFSLEATDDFSWQMALQLDNPAPSKDEINAAYRRLVQKHHPDAIDNGSGGDPAMFEILGNHRKNAIAWISGSSAKNLENCIPIDRFISAKLNLAAIASALRHFRGLEAIGAPAILERVMASTFRAALPAGKGVSDVQAVSA